MSDEKVLQEYWLVKAFVLHYLSESIVPWGSNPNSVFLLFAHI
jgi:hypothetical protein